MTQDELQQLTLEDLNQLMRDLFAEQERRNNLIEIPREMKAKAAIFQEAGGDKADLVTIIQEGA